jgi:hypothetical protein
MQAPKPLFPDFLLVGAATCGTTSFCHYLENHPRIDFNPVNERGTLGRPARLAAGPAAGQAADET